MRIGNSHPMFRFSQRLSLQKMPMLFAASPRPRIARGSDLQAIESRVLAPFAVLSGLSLGREHVEQPTEDGFRTPFQRDIDRIIWSNAFQRLSGKTQVFGEMGNDHTRTRQSHSYTVARIAREICQALRLNQDLAEAIALAHDLGHPPFGHCGQDILNDCMRDYGGFEHNKQTLRLVTQLEHRYANFPGLNLTYEVRDGLCKHFRHAPLIDRQRLPLGGNASLEAAIVNIADQIAYSHHDLEDGLRLGFLNADDLAADVTLWREAAAETPPEKAMDDRLKNLHVIRLMIKTLVRDLIFETAQRLNNKRITGQSQVAGRAQTLVGFSDGVGKKNAQLRAYLMKNLYHNPRKLTWEVHSQSVIGGLFRFFIAHPEKYRELDTRPSTPDDLHRSVCDFIAGMTDEFALSTHKLFHHG